MNSTVWWESKQLWGALLIFAATLAQAKWGFVIDPLTQGYIVSAIIVIMRLITKGPVTSTKDADPVGDAKAYAVQTEATAVKADIAAESAEAALAEVKVAENK